MSLKDGSPCYCLKMYILTGGSNYPLAQVSEETFRTLNPKAIGAPAVFCMTGEFIRLWPAPVTENIYETKIEIMEP